MPKNMKLKKNTSLNNEEKDLLDSFEKGEWKTVKDFEKQKALAQEAASNYSKKNARINIRISDFDLTKIKLKAAYEGIPYQTLIASILHKYAAGHFSKNDDK